MPETMPGPSGPGTVVLDIGGDAGALIIYAPEKMDGAEIEVSAWQPPGPTTHALVRARRAAGGCHAAVYPALPAGDYTIWRDQLTPAGVVTVRGGAVTRYHWPP
jgi:hypothetical protein